ncbi:MAG: class I SAM-dependent methyltransferase [Ilumatobacteraceae bacterium]
MTADDPYRDLADEYHWFFDDRALVIGCDTPGVRAVMAGLDEGARVLDAACGIGVDAAGLLRRGLDVTATDASAAMVEHTRRRLADVVPSGRHRVLLSSWVDLPVHVEPHTFDAVFCIGNSIAHAQDRRAMVAAFTAFHTVLAPGGVLVVDSFDWELLGAAGSRLEVEPEVVERDGVRCVRAYAWTGPAAAGDPWVLEIAPILLDGDRATLRSHRVDLYPFTRRELRERLESAGFEGVAIDAVPRDDRFTAVARRPTG